MERHPTHAVSRASFYIFSRSCRRDSAAGRLSAAAAEAQPLRPPRRSARLLARCRVYNLPLISTSMPPSGVDGGPGRRAARLDVRRTSAFGWLIPRGWGAGASAASISGGGLVPRARAPAGLPRAIRGLAWTPRPADAASRPPAPRPEDAGRLEGPGGSAPRLRNGPGPAVGLRRASGAAPLSGVAITA